VIEEDHPQPYAAEQIQSEVTLDEMRERYLILIGHYAPSICPVGYRPISKKDSGTPAKIPCVRGPQSKGSK
jgi:hypothetical protein